ncbi:2-dehydropantoate 2-reductase [Kribbella sp. NPDC051587]|uniref:2-dehydropantoate 2-reductase n=1 Tax=Kribbella sp. NPDC051587 TaxID=3364119 RepID=UPI0037A528DD
MTIVVYGAGDIGCYVGGRLLASGSDVTFVGRRRMADELADHGLRLSDYLGTDLRIEPGDLSYATSPAAASRADLLLLTVKSAATATAADELADVLKPDTVVISFQNGLRNGAILSTRLPANTVLSGMVPFNVVNDAGGHFHQGTEGTLFVQRDPALTPYERAFARAGLPLLEHDEILPVQWAKLLLNLINPINALSDLPMQTQLSQHAFRLCWAAALDEAMNLLAMAGIEPAQILRSPMSHLPDILRLPDFLYRRSDVLPRMDPLARTSMWQDLQAGQPTEIDYLNGEVVRLAESLGRTAPINARLVALVRAAERNRRTWTGPELLHELGR